MRAAADGTFSVHGSRPGRAHAAIYRATTDVPRLPGSKRLSATYTLATPVDLR